MSVSRSRPRRTSQALAPRHSSQATTNSASSCSSDSHTSSSSSAGLTRILSWRPSASATRYTGRSVKRPVSQAASGVPPSGLPPSGLSAASSAASAAPQSSSKWRRLAVSSASSSAGSSAARRARKRATLSAACSSRRMSSSAWRSTSIRQTSSTATNRPLTSRLARHRAESGAAIGSSLGSREIQRTTNTPCIPLPSSPLLKKRYLPGLIGTKKISASPASSNSSSTRVTALTSTPPASTLRR
ncbi:hypothetical protein D3C80_1158200 [compost metagenome]